VTDLASYLSSGRGILGIELGSTRIKAVLIGPDHAPIASGGYTWENRLENGVWTYHLEDAWTGIQAAYAQMAAQAKEKYGVALRRLRAIGISGMMHGYLPFDKKGNQLAPFRTWRNTMTGKAAEELTGLLSFNIPQRWSIAHLYQAVLSGEAHVEKISHLTTLAGFVHWQLTGEQVLGVGEASGMFPIDSQTGQYDKEKLEKMNAAFEKKGCPWKLEEILPRVEMAGGNGGQLTEKGARLLDPSGMLEAGALAAPPEGDAGTGMVATNSVRIRTGNVSAGTSIFAMVVLEKPLSRVYPEIDMVTTPTGQPVAMVHCNNCTSDLNAWAGIFKGFAAACGKEISEGEIYHALFTSAMAGEKDCGGLVNINYLSGEHVTGFEEGRPMTVRLPDARATFPNFARALVSSALVSLKIGMGILEKEQVKIDSLLGHGGFFKTPGTAQNLLAAALKAPVALMETAGEGGPWGMALLAAYRANREEGESLEAYLEKRVFAWTKRTVVAPDHKDALGMDTYTERFQKTLAAERAAVEYMK